MAEQVFYEVARWRLDEQLAQMRELNTRLATVFTAAIALVVLFSALGSYENIIEHPAVLSLLLAGGAVYVVLVAVTAYGLVNRALFLGPALEDARQLSRTASEDEQAIWAAERITRAVRANERALRAKGRFAATAVLLWAGDVLLFAASALLLAV